MSNDLENIRALVVDDDEIVLTVMKSALEAEGCTVSVCHGGLETINLLETIHRDFDVVILDFVMPDINGDEVLTRIRSHEIKMHLKSIPIFSHSGHITNKERDELIAKGYTDIMVKPIDLDDLFQKIIHYYKLYKR